MNNIVNRNLVQNLGSNISSTYIPETGAGQAIAQGVSSLANTFVSIASMYNKEQKQEREDLAAEQAQADLEAYEKAAASLFEYQQTYNLSPTETSIRHSQLQKHFSHVPANKRSQIDSQYMFNVQQNLYEAEAKNAIEAQHAAEKAQVEEMRSRFPGIFNTLSYEESVVKAKDMQQYAGVLANLAAGYGEKDDYSNDMYLAAAKKGVVDEMYNYLGVISKDTPITADNLAEIELKLQQEYIKNGVDARIATMATEQVLEPYKRVIKTYSETSTLSAKALEDAFKAQLSPITRFALNNPQTLQYLPPSSRGYVDAEIVREMETWNESKANSVNDLFSYRDFGTAPSKTTPQATTTSFNIGFAVMNGASAEDNEIQRNIAVNTSLKLRDQVNFKEAQAEQLPVPLEGRSFMDAQADYNNNMAITEGQIGLLGAYTTGPKYNKGALERDINRGLERAVKGSVDMYLIQKNDPNPASRAAARDLNAEALATQAGYSVGTLWEDLSSGTQTDHRVIFDEEKGEIRMLEKLRDVELIDRFTGRVLDIEGKKWIDVTDQWGIEGATQDTFKANRDKVNASVDKFCEIEGMSSKECSEYKKSLWRNAAEPFKGQVKTTGGQAGEIAQAALGAPYEAAKAAGEGLAKAKIVGDKVDAAALEGLKMAGEGAEDLGSKAISSSKELFQKATEGAEDVGEKVGYSVSKPVVMLGGVGYTIGELAASNETSDKTLGKLLAGISEQLKKGKELVEKETPESLSEVLLGLKSTLKGLIDNTPDGMSLLLSKEDAEALGEIWTKLGLEVNEQFRVDENGNVAILKESLQTMYELAEVATDLEYEEEYKKNPYFDTQGIPTVGIGFNMETLVNRLKDVKKYAPGFYGFMTEEVVNKIKEYASIRNSKNATAEAIAAKRTELESVLAGIYIDKTEADLLLHKLMIDAYKEAKSSSKVKPYWDKLSQTQRKFFTKFAYNAGIGNLAGFSKMHEALLSSASYNAAIEFLSSKLPAQTKGRSLKLATELLDWDSERAKQALKDYEAGKREGDAGVLESLFEIYTEFFKRHKKPKEKDRNPADDLRLHLYK